MCRSRFRWRISWEDAQAVASLQKQTGLVCMVGHTRRFNPSHQWLNKRLRAGELKIQQMDVQTYFFRRTNTNALGQAEVVDGSPAVASRGAYGGSVSVSDGRGGHDRACGSGAEASAAGIAMDMSIQLKTKSGAICTLSLSFNNDGPLGTFFRYICDNGTYIARYDDLVNGKEEKIDVSKVDVSMNGIELQDREFFAAIRREAGAEFECASGVGVLSHAARVGAAVEGAGGRSS